MKKKNKNAFTVIELLIVVGVIAILTVTSFYSWKKSRDKIIFNQAKESVLLMLREARNKAETGFQTNPNSVCHYVDYSDAEKKLILSERCGSACDSDCGDKKSIYLSASVQNLPVFFKRLSAESLNKEIKILAGGKEATIRISADGSIYELNN